jgi:hypothetical protein
LRAIDNAAAATSSTPAPSAPSSTPPSSTPPSSTPPSKPAAPAKQSSSVATDGQGAEKTGSNAAPPPKAAKPATLGGGGGAGGGGGMSEDEIKKMIIAHEGVRNKPYKDSLGLWTVGVGHLIGDGKSLPKEWDREFSKEEIMKMFEDDYAHHRLAAQKIPGFNKLGTLGQGALTDLTFNMGPNWIQKWPKLKEQLANLDLAGAASNLRQSKWFEQVKNRGPKIVGLLENSTVTVEKASTGAMFEGPTEGYFVQLHGKEFVGNQEQLSAIKKLIDIVDQSGMLSETTKSVEVASGTDIDDSVLLEKFTTMLEYKIDELLEKIKFGNRVDSDLLNYSQG